MKTRSNNNFCVHKLSFDDSDSDTEFETCETNSISLNFNNTSSTVIPDENAEPSNDFMDVEGTNETELLISKNREQFNINNENIYTHSYRRIPQSAPPQLPLKRISNRTNSLKKIHTEKSNLTTTSSSSTTTAIKVISKPLPEFETIPNDNFNDIIQMESDPDSQATPQYIRKNLTPITRIKCPDTPLRKHTFSRITPQTVSHPRHFYVNFTTTKIDGNNEEQLKMTSNDFTFLEKIGEGSFGIVYKVISTKTNKIYALKKSKKYIPYNNFNENDPRIHLKEVDLALSVSNHPNIVRTFQAWEEYDRHLYILSEFCDFSLSEFVEKQWIHKSKLSFLPETQILCFAADMFCGVSYLHDMNIIHLDLKPENMFVKCEISKLTVKIGDFGIAYKKDICNDDYLPMTGDNKYMAPELLDDVFEFAADVFSLGITLYELTHPGIVLPSNGERWKALRSNDIDFGIWKYSNELKEIILLMLNSDYFKRPTVKQLLSSPLIKPFISK